jgi:hypothetical protein
MGAAQGLPALISRPRPQFAYYEGNTLSLWSTVIVCLELTASTWATCSKAATPDRSLDLLEQEGSRLDHGETQQGEASLTHLPSRRCRCSSASFL